MELTFESNPHRLLYNKDMKEEAEILWHARTSSPLVLWDSIWGLTLEMISGSLWSLTWHPVSVIFFEAFKDPCRRKTRWLWLATVSSSSSSTKTFVHVSEWLLSFWLCLAIKSQGRSCEEDIRCWRHRHVETVHMLDYNSWEHMISSYFKG